jgi:hypothetical protein
MEAKQLSSSEIVYVSHVHVERIRGPLRRAEVPGSAEPIYFGVHDEVADHYGVARGGEAERTTTLDYVVAAAAG